MLTLTASGGCRDSGQQLQRKPDAVEASEDASATLVRRPQYLRRPQAIEPQRLVSLAPSVTEILFALGAGDRVVGVTRYCDYPAAAQLRSKVGGFLDPSLEAVVALKPDLVITVPSGQNRVVVERLAEMGLAVLLTYAYDLHDVRMAIPAIGEAIGRRKQAQALLAQLDQELNSVRQATRALARPRVLFVIGHRPIIAAGAGSYADELLTIAGGLNVAGAGLARYPTLSIESVIGYAPDVIVDAYMDGRGAAEPLGGLQLDIIPAVRNHRVHQLGDDAVLRPGPRCAAAARQLSALLHPNSAP